MAIACPDCGTVQVLQVPPRKTLAYCVRCNAVLERRTGRSINAGLALAAATLILLVPANVLPFLRIGMMGFTAQSRLGSGVVTFWDQHWVLLAVGVAAFGIALPIIRFALLTASLAAVQLGYRPPWIGAAFRWEMALAPWAMPEVFLIGCFVGYSRIAVNLTPAIGAGGWCFIGAALLSMLADAALDRRSVWRAIEPERQVPLIQPVLSCAHCDLVLPLEWEGRRCPRCRARLWARKKDGTIRTTALVLAGYLLYLPANFFPMTNLIRLGHVQGHTIIDGIVELFGAGLWPLGVVIFCTSIAVPLLKLLGLSWMILALRRRSRRALRARTWLHRVIRTIGRWSNVDVFTIVVFAPLMQFGRLATVRTGIGAEAFFCVVVVTMLACRAFDPRAMWDVAEEAT